MTTLTNIQLHTFSSLIAGLAWVLYALYFWRALHPFMPVYLRRLGAALLLIIAFQILMDEITHTNYLAGETLGELFSLDGELNIPAAFTSLLMVAAGGTALRLAVNTRPSNLQVRSWLMCLYWLALGIGFFLLAADEYWFHWHNIDATVNLLYRLTGVLIGGATIAIFFLWETPARRRYLLWLILGLVMSASGAFYLEYRWLWMSCVEDWLFVLYRNCQSEQLHFFPLEETLELLGMLTIGLALLSYASTQTRAGEKVVQPLGRRRGLIQLAQIALLLLIAYFASRQLEYGPVISPRLVTVSWGEQTPTLLGYRLNWRWRSNESIGKVGKEAPTVFLNFRAEEPLSENFGHTLALVDQVTGAVVAKQAEWNRLPAAEWQPEQVYEQGYLLPIPADTPTHRARWLTIQLWQQDEEGSFHPLHIQSSTQATLSETEVVLTEWVWPQPAPAEEKSGPPLAYFGLHLTLQHASFPTQARAGEPLSIDFRWETNHDLDEDWSQFLHFVHEESGHFWNHDQPPLGARLPTRLWYTGMVDQENWQLTLPAELPPGSYQLYTGLYHLSDMARLAGRERAGNALLDDRLPLGTIEILAAPD